MFRLHVNWNTVVETDAQQVQLLGGQEVLLWLAQESGWWMEVDGVDVGCVSDEQVEELTDGLCDVVEHETL